MALERSFAQDWMAAYQVYCRGESSLPEAMALLHPEHYAGHAAQATICGQRAFAREPGVGAYVCRARTIWGYDCARKGDEADHMFPYSLGGFTVAANKIYLCSLHNRLKSADVHLFMWEGSEPPWLSAALRQIASIKSRA
jgi:hypothetical protein